MTARILLVGRRQERIDGLVAQLRERGLIVQGTADFDHALALALAGEVDAVAIGAGLDDAVRLPFAARVRAEAPGVVVHVKSDRTGGPAAMIPFVEQIAAGPQSRP